MDPYTISSYSIVTMFCDWFFFLTVLVYEPEPDFSLCLNQVSFPEKEPNFCFRYPDFSWGRNRISVRAYTGLLGWSRICPQAGTGFFLGPVPDFSHGAGTRFILGLEPDYLRAGSEPSKSSKGVAGLYCCHIVFLERHFVCVQNIDIS